MKKPISSLNFQIILLSLIRFFTNISIKMFYPFLPFLASGLGVSLNSLSLALSTRSLIGTFNPLVATAISDRRGRKAGMLAGLAIFLISNLAVVLFPSFPVLFVAISLSFFGTLVFSSAMQAYLGDAIAYERRGRVLAFSEMAWSMATIIGMPVVAFLLARSGWIGPFWVLVGVGILALILVARLVPSTKPAASEKKSSLTELRRVLSSPPALMALVMCLFFAAGNELINVVFGTWMKGSFGLEIGGLGMVATIIGISELCAETTVAQIVDRLGKIRTIRAGLIVSTLAVVLLFFFGRNVAGAIFFLFLYVLGYETVAVSNLPLMSEVMPDARATMMALMTAFYSIGRAISAFTSLRIYAHGFQFNILAVVCINLIAFLLLYKVKAANPHLQPSVESSGG